MKSVSDEMQVNYSSVCAYASLLAYSVLEKIFNTINECLIVTSRDFQSSLHGEYGAIEAYFSGRVAKDFYYSAKQRLMSSQDYVPPGDATPSLCSRYLSAASTSRFINEITFP